MVGQPEHVLVIGAGLAGLRTVEHLRASGHQGRISIVGAEPHSPYDRPPLSKQLLSGAWTAEKIVLRDDAGLDELGVRTFFGLGATALRHHGSDASGRARLEVELSDGATLHGDVVVVATGVAARTLPGQPAHAHVLRTLDHAVALRAALDGAGSLLVIGGGFIGAEVATVAREKGLAVTVLEAAEAPAVRALGPRLGALAGRLMTENGVDLRTGVRITGFPEAGDRVAVDLIDGTRLDADVAVVGVGGAPETAWLPAEGPDGALVDTGNGLACGPTGRVDGLPGVWAVGDVANRADENGRRHRTEHWTNAGDQALVVARDVLGADAPPDAVPYVWSDQFGMKIQQIGLPHLGEEIVPLHGDGLSGGSVKGTVAAHLADGRLVGVTGFGAPRLVVRYRAAVISGAGRDELAETTAALATR